MGQGMLLLGEPGPPSASASNRRLQLLGNQIVGFVSGEWRGVGGRPLHQMIAAIVVLLAAVLVLALGKALTLMTTQNILPRALAAAGKKTCWRQSPDGTRVLLLPYGARVLGLFPPKSDDNFFWVNPALRATTSREPCSPKRAGRIRAAIARGSARRSRCSFPIIRNAVRHVEPATLDAAEYAVAARTGRRGDDAHDDARLCPRQAIGEAAAEQVGRAAPNPLRYERCAAKLLAGVEYAGYTQRTRVKLLDDAARSPLPVGIWNLIQLPHGGEMIIPTYRAGATAGAVRRDSPRSPDVRSPLPAFSHESSRRTQDRRPCGSVDGARRLCLAVGPPVVAGGAELLHQSVGRVRRRAQETSRRIAVTRSMP